MILLTNFKYGKIFISDKDFYIGQCLFNYGEYCEEEVDVFKQVLRNDDNVIEVGANIGSLSVPISQSIKNGILYAIEPQQYIFNMLCANVAVNNLNNVKPKLLAIGDSIKEIKMPIINYEQMNNFGGISINGEYNGEVIKQTTLDSMFPDLSSLRLIKIDVEGMEFDVLNGAKDLIEKHRPHIYCEFDRPENNEKILKLFNELDYDVYKHISNLYHVTNFKNKSENVFDKAYICINVLAIPKELGFKTNLIKIN